MREIAATSLIQAFVGEPGLAVCSWVFKAIFETICVFFFPFFPVADCAVNKYLCMHFCFFFHMHKTWLMNFSVTSLFTEMSFLPQRSILAPVLLRLTCLGEAKKSGNGEAETSKDTASTGK